MTLVIGNSRKQTPFLVADTMISAPLSGAGIMNSQLKVAFPDRDIAVAFSGSPEVAESDVKKYSKLLDKSFQATKEYFVATTRTSQNHYLISFGKSGQLLRVRNGQVDKPVGTGWIGDKAAFENYQVFKNSKPHMAGPEWIFDELPEAAHDAYPAMRVLREIIERRRAEHRQVPTIGHFVSIAAMTPAGYRIAGQVTSYADGISNFADRLGRHYPIFMGENFGYRATVCPPKQAGVSAAVFAFPDANKAYLYAAPDGHFGKLLEVYALPLEQALEAAHNETGIAFELHDSKNLPPLL